MELFSPSDSILVWSIGNGAGAQVRSEAFYKCYLTEEKRMEEREGWGKGGRKEGKKKGEEFACN